MSTTASARTGARPEAGSGIDPRGPQFNAAVTVVVLVAILVTAGTAVGTVLTAVQAALFAWGAIGGVQTTIHAKVFKALIRPRLASPDHLEDPAPPRFAQAVGLGFAAVALVGFLVGGTTVGTVAIALALVAATLNAVFRFCLGCEVYLLIKRATS
ncbi:protein of unknown function [Nocardioides terrae]|uniref:DUF4395 domain-containing protein n=1 Tax=Nocardioides terrae TaxID=574651 RepID=A0A1I1ELG8_9ACTN|nr:DUF4395 domain-containing protein [Nocardioides terrae]SFB87925.1 protein of unknown function [Nocardioides terrae]